MNSARVIVSLLVQCVILSNNIANSYKILVLPMNYRSHIISLTRICNEISERGHQVHILIPKTYPLTSELGLQKSRINVEFYGKDDINIDYRNMENRFMSIMFEKQGDLGAMKEAVGQYVDAESRQLLTDNDILIERLQNIKFDLAIVDSLFFVKFLYLIPLRLGIPWVTYSDLLPAWPNRIPHLPSFVPVKLSTYTDRMNFCERTINLIMTFASVVGGFPDPAEELLASYRKYGEFSVLDDLISKSLLFITTSDIVLSYPAPSMPNLIQIGGLTTGPPSGRPFPAEMEKIMSTAREGVIIVTFGSMASQLPKRISEKFLEAFSKLHDYTFLWRFDNKDKLSIPNNVMLSNWLPQNDILADSRVKLFITHSGNNGQFEAVYHAVPMIGFSIVGDQPYNAKRIEAKGYGISMNIHDFTSQQLQDNIHRILKDGSYKQRIGKASEIFRSARESPAERAAYWIEHVIRFGGDHLRSDAYDLNLFQFLLIDVLLFLTVTVVSAFFLLWCFVKCTCRNLLRSQNDGTASKREKSL